MPDLAHLTIIQSKENTKISHFSLYLEVSNYRGREVNILSLAEIFHQLLGPKMLGLFLEQTQNAWIIP